MLFYYVNERCVDIFEESIRRQWSKGEFGPLYIVNLNIAGRTFLLDVPVTHLSMSDFTTGARLKLYKWDFELGDADPDTAHFLRCQTRRPESSDEPAGRSPL